MKKRLQNMLSKAGWKTRRWDWKFELATIRLGHQEEFGFRCFTIQYQYREYSLFSFFFSFPNRTTRQVATVEEWDILWSHHAMWRWYDRTTDSLMWSGNAPDKWTTVRLWVLNRLFR